MNKKPNPAENLVRARLRDVARETGTELQLLLTHYGIERLIYRLAQSAYRDRFILKGAMLFNVWALPHTRPTRDVDFLAHLEPDREQLVAIFSEICQLQVEPDGLQFLAESVKTSPIREENEYGGIRVKLVAKLGKSKVPIQVDIGIGDAVSPPPRLTTYPVLISDFPAPRIKTYPVYTVIAEKVETIVKLGIVNSRMKDYYDLWLLLKQEDLEEGKLKTAMKATFTRRATPIPANKIIGLSPAFANNPDKVKQWQAFTKRSLPAAQQLDLETVVNDIAKTLLPFLSKMAK